MPIDQKLRQKMVQPLLEMLDLIEQGKVTGYAFIGVGQLCPLLMRGQSSTAELIGAMENAKLKLWFQTVINAEADNLDFSALTEGLDLGEPN